MWGTMICKKQNHIRFANENCFRISLNSWRVPADSYVPWILLMDQRFWQTSQINNWQCLIWDSQVKIVEKLWVQNSLFAKRYLAWEFRMDIELQMAQKELINCLNTYYILKNMWQGLKENSGLIFLDMFQCFRFFMYSFIFKRTFPTNFRWHRKELINCLNTYWRKCDKGWRNIVIWFFWICFI